MFERTVRVVSHKPSEAYRASGMTILRTTEQDTSPSSHWSPASREAPSVYILIRVENPQILSALRVFILWGMALLPTWPSLKPSVTSS